MNSDTQKHKQLSVYEITVFSMLGGMILPFLLGVCFYNEKLTLLKVVCCILIIVAVLLNIKKGENAEKTIPREIKEELGLPVKWIGVGEGIMDFRPFEPEKFVEALFETDK